MSQIYPEQIDCDCGKKYNLPTSKKVLDEDEDQGEMDMIFWGGLIIYTILQCFMSSFYPDDKDYEAIGKFNIVMTNLWAFFPIMQAQGLLLKTLLILTCWYSILWHWTQAGFPMPGDKMIYGNLDAMFSALVIQAYALSWFPKLKTYKPTKEDESGRCGWWYKSCRGPPKETSEWRCRWTPNLIGIVIVCIIFGLIYYYDWKKPGGSDLPLYMCWGSIGLAVILALYHLFRGKMKVGRRYRRNFVFWVITGIPFGIIAFIYKSKSNVGDKDSYMQHSIWHVYVFSCAYCLSRAQEYLEIY